MDDEKDLKILKKGKKGYVMFALIRQPWLKTQLKSLVEIQYKQGF